MKVLKGIYRAMLNKNMKLYILSFDTAYETENMKEAILLLSMFTQVQNH